MVKVKDVAQAAGVSVSTVSRALRGHSVIPTETRVRVQEVARQLNYVPDRAASNLRSRRTNTVALFVNNLTSRQSSEFHDGVEAVCAEQGYLLILQQLDGNETRTRRYVQLLREQRVDGVIVVPHLSGIYTEEIGTMREWGLTVVQIDNQVPDALSAGDDYVGCDNVLGARLAAEHLLSLGHRRFGLISPVSPLSCINERVTSFEAVVRSHGATVETRVVSPTQDSLEFARVAAHALLDSPARPTALFSTAGPGAFSILRALRERGLRCPDDVAVATFDDDLYGPYLETPLTSVAWPAFEIGRRAAELLLSRLSNRETGPGQQIVLPPILIRRDSTLTRAGGL